MIQVYVPAQDAPDLGQDLCIIDEAGKQVVVWNEVRDEECFARVEALGQMALIDAVSRRAEGCDLLRRESIVDGQHPRLLERPPFLVRQPVP